MFRCLTLFRTCLCYRQHNLIPKIAGNNFVFSRTYSQTINWKRFFNCVHNYLFVRLKKPLNENYNQPKIILIFQQTIWRCVPPKTYISRYKNIVFFLEFQVQRNDYQLFRSFSSWAIELWTFVVNCRKK